MADAGLRIMVEGHAVDASVVLSLLSIGISMYVLWRDAHHK